MRCLYCGKPLPLLKKLTGGGEFCSDAHRHKYQEEYNKLALSRLLQAQAPAAEGGAPRGARQLPPPSARAGQRALPPPRPRQLAAPSGPPPPMPPPLSAQPSTVAPPPSFNPFEPPAPPRAATPPPAPTPATTAAPPMPPPAPMPDPPYAAFQLRPVPPAKPGSSTSIRRDVVEGPQLCSEEAAARPEFEMQSGLEADAFAWEETHRLAQEPDFPEPPEAAPWEHPIRIAAPPEVARLLWLDAEFSGKPLIPAFPEVELQIRYPAPVARKAPMHAAARTPLAPAVPAPVAAKQWNVSLSLPDWRPRLPVVLAPAIGVPVLAAAAPVPETHTEPEVFLAAGVVVGAAAGEPVESVTEAPEPLEIKVEVLPLPPPPPPPAPKVQPVAQEVYIDLAILEMLEGKSPARQGK